MSKMRVSEHKAALAAVKMTHVTFAVTEREALATLEADLDAALRKAGGADYDAGNAAAGVRAGATSSIKSSSKSFFEQKDRETEVRKIQFEKVRALASLSLRSMTDWGTSRWLLIRAVHS